MKVKKIKELKEELKATRAEANENEWMYCEASAQASRAKRENRFWRKGVLLFGSLLVLNWWLD